MVHAPHSPRTATDRLRRMAADLKRDRLHSKAWVPPMRGRFAVQEGFVAITDTMANWDTLRFSTGFSRVSTM